MNNDFTERLTRTQGTYTLTKGRQDRTTAVTIAFGLPALYSETIPHTVKQLKHAVSHSG